MKKRKCINRYMRIVFIILCYMSCMALISYLRAPEQYRMRTLLTFDSGDFKILENANKDTKIKNDSLYMKNGELNGVSGFYVDVPLKEAYGVAVDFVVNCPYEFSNSLMYIDLCAENYDNVEQERVLKLQAGSHRVSIKIDPGEQKPNQSRLRFFITDPVEVRIDSLSVNILSDTPNSIIFILVLIAFVTFIISAFIARKIKKDNNENENKISRQRKAKYLFLIVFILILYIPMCITCLSILVGKRIDTNLLGYFVKKEKPEVSISVIMDSSYQKHFNNWWDENFGFRGVIIKTYNQIRYTFFSEGNRVIGKDGSVFEPLYIESELGLTPELDFSRLENQQKLCEYVQKLNLVSEKLKSQGKGMIVYTSTNKASYHKDVIPNFYIAQYNPSAISSIEYFRQLRNEGKFQFAYLDSYEELAKEKNKGYPVFYKTGIHWSRPAEQFISQRLIECVEKELGYDIPKIKLTTLNSRKKPYWRDADVYDLLNIWHGQKDDKYYQYNTMVENDGPFSKTYNMLLVGGSFAMGLESDFNTLKLGNSIDYINYQYTNGYKYLRHNQVDLSPITSISDLDIQDILDRNDIFIFEINECVLKEKSCTDEFLDELIKVLDTYSADIPSIQCLDFSKDQNEIKGGISGFYWLEDTHVWSSKRSFINLKNDKIQLKGMEIRFFIPNELPAKIGNQFRIFVNNNLVYEHSLTKKGEFSVVLSPEQIGDLEENDLYVVSFECDESFNPKDLGMVDDRDLSFSLQYIGAVREEE